MKKKKSFLFKFLIFLLICVLLLIGGYLYISLVFVPHNLKNILAEKAQEALNRKVTLETVDIDLMKGITVKNLTVFDKNDRDQIFISTDTITFKILFAPIFKNKIVYLPSITLDSPVIHVSQQSKGQWNFSDLLSRRSSSSEGKSNYQVTIQKFIIENGSVHLTDLSTDKPFNETLDDINLSASISLNQKAEFEFDSTLKNNRSPISVKGEYIIPNKLGTLNISAQNIHPLDYTWIAPKSIDAVKDGIINQIDIEAKVNKNKIDINGSSYLTKVKLKPSAGELIEGSFELPRFSLNYSDGNIYFQGQTNIKSANLSADNLSISQADILADINSLNLTGNLITYNGSLSSQNLEIKKGSDTLFSGDINLTKLQLIKNDEITLKGDFFLNQASINYSPIEKLTGNIELTTANISISNESLKLSGDLSLSNTNAEIKNNDQTISVTGDIKTTELRLSKQGDVIDIKSNLNLTDGHINLGNGMTLKDSFPLEISLKTDGSELDYDGSIQFYDATITGLPKINSVENLNGDIDFKKNSASLRSLKFYSQNIPVQLSGTINEFSKPTGKLSIQVPSLDLESLSPVISTFVKDVSISLTGSADLNANIDGPLTDILAADINATSNFSRVSVSGEKIPYPITNMSGSLNASKNNAEFNNVTLTVLDKDYFVSGLIENLKEPTITAAVTSDDLNFDTKVTKIDNNIQITKLDGKYLKTTFDVRGKITTIPDQEPYLDLTLRSGLSLTDLKYIPQLAKLAKENTPVGVFAIDGYFKGKLKDMQSWNTAFNASSVRMSIKDIPLEDVKLRFVQMDKSPYADLSASAVIYDGLLSSDTAINTSLDELPAQFSITLDRLDLSRMRENRNTRASRLSGFVSSQINGNGSIKNLKRSIQGEGSLVVVEGYLGQLDLFNGILGALLVVPEFKNMLITDASVNFDIQNGRVSSENILLSSPTVQLNGRGWIDFNSNIEVEVSPNLSQIEMVKSESARKLPTQILANAVSVKCTGTTSDPQCRMDNAPGKILQETTDILKDGLKSVGSIFEEIF